MKLSFDVDVWGFTIVFYTDVKEANSDTSLELDEISTFTYNNTNKILIIIDGCNKGMPTQDNLRYIVHETNHAAMRILNRVGVTFDCDNQEALCYTQDFIFSRIIHELIISAEPKDKGDG
jgi:hypothetical protein